MIPVFADFLFDGVERWQLGFDNPNKAAILFAELVIFGVWLVQCRQAVWFWCGYVVATVSAFALLHTISRGGLLACGIGLTMVWGAAKAGIIRGKRLILIVLSLIFLFLSAVHLKVHKRCMHGVVDEDASIKNRIVLWASAPAMFRAASRGWGIGRSGEAYIKWFQPTDRQERYRTLVNSHLTWLVEIGWGLGFLYLYGWCCALWSGWKMRDSIDHGLCIGEAICLFIGGVFSSVLESIWLWIVPILSFSVSFRLASSRRLFSAKGFLLCGCVVLIMVCGLVVYPVSDCPLIRKFKDGVRCGEGGSEICLFADPDVLGGEFYMRELRDALKTRSGTINVISTVPDISHTADLIVLSGQECHRIHDVTKLHPDKRVLLISPPFELYELLRHTVTHNRIRIWIGALSNSPFLDAGDSVTVFLGADQYIPLWGERTFELIGDWQKGGQIKLTQEELSDITAIIRAAPSDNSALANLSPNSCPSSKLR